MKPIFISGIGTGVGKTLVSAILTEALQAAYWKPVQAGIEGTTDSGWVSDRVRLLSPAAPASKGNADPGPPSSASRPVPGSSATATHPLPGEPATGSPPSRIFPETYKLALAASPHIAARQEGRTIQLEKIAAHYHLIEGQLAAEDWLVIEGAGGLLVPLNEQEFVIDLVQRLDAPLVLVSRNYLGSINHSLLTAAACKTRGLRVAGWIFNDQYLHYEEEIQRWTGIPTLASIPHTDNPDAAFIRHQAEKIGPSLRRALSF